MNIEAHQQDHESHETNTIASAREDEFAPIQSSPLLKWDGKRPITLIQDDPARYEETRGPEINGWRSRICWGDSLQTISHLSIELRGKINLIYITPSLDLKKTHKKSKNMNNAYLQNIFENLILIRELLSPDGCVYVHCDQRDAHRLRNILDEIFGMDNFINQLAWEHTDTHRTAQPYSALRDTILLYGKSEIHTFDPPFNEFDQGNIERHHVNLANTAHAPSREVRIGYISFNDINLSNVLTIEVSILSLSSFIGIDTIIDFLGKIPKSFLHEVGVPKTFITNMHALVSSMPSIKFYSCFISYSHQNEDLAKRLYTDLQQKGVRCWFASEDMKIGDKIRPRIDEAIHLQDKLLLLLSEDSIASTWVENEVEAALEREDRQQREVLFPIRLDDAVMQTSRAWAATLRRTRYIGNFTNWTDPQAYQRAFKRLLRDLKQS